MPDEPLKLTLGEANELVRERGFLIVPSGNGSRPWELLEISTQPRHDIGLLYTWEEGAEIALDRPVVARDDTAELRAAIKEWVDATDAEGAAHHDHGEGHITTDEYMAAFERYDSARSNLRRLAREAQ